MHRTQSGFRQNKSITDNYTKENLQGCQVEKKGSTHNIHRYQQSIRLHTALAHRRSAQVLQNKSKTNSSNHEPP